MAFERMIYEMLLVVLTNVVAFRSTTFCTIAAVKCSAGVKPL